MSTQQELDVMAKEISSQRNLPYTIKIEKIEGEKLFCRSSWGNHIIYIKKKDKYFLETEL
jgi:hypothetical protein